MYLQSHDRKRFRALLELVERTAVSHGNMLPLISDVGGFLIGCGSPGDASVDKGFVAFTGMDGKRYYCSMAGLWMFDEKAKRVMPDEWFFAFLRVQTHWRFLERVQVIVGR